MAKLAALLVLTAAALLGLFEAPAAAAGFVGHLLPPVEQAPARDAVILALAGRDAVVVADPAPAGTASGTPTVPTTPTVPMTPATPGAPGAPGAPGTPADPATPSAPPAPPEHAAVLAPALQVAAGYPEPDQGRLEVLGEQVAGPAASTTPARPGTTGTGHVVTGPGLARTGMSTDDLVGLALGLIAVGSVLCRRARGRRGTPNRRTRTATHARGPGTCPARCAPVRLRAWSPRCPGGTSPTSSPPSPPASTPPPVRRSARR